MPYNSTDLFRRIVTKKETTTHVDAASEGEKFTE